MTYAEQLERETEQSRANLTGTIEELRASITPGQVIDQFTDYARDRSIGAFTRNLRHQAVENPMSLALIGAGLTWMMIGNGRAMMRDGGARGGNGLQRGAESAAAKGRAAADRASDRIAEGAEAVRERASESAAEFGAAASGKASALTERVSGAAEDAGNRIAESASSATTAIQDSTSRAYDAAA
ncbi:MAG TPA: DUF3618 domain-containing protein, partial [Xanthobacteraceae bacterium]|nr:DUF3618 domain-containing protein [Xanthobacteraceae bacterium]